VRPLGAFKQFGWDNVTDIAPMAKRLSLDCILDNYNWTLHVAVCIKSLNELSCGNIYELNRSSSDKISAYKSIVCILYYYQ